MKYVVLVEDDECSFCATSPDVPGIWSFGETAEEALLGFREALPYHLQAIREAGGPVPQPKTQVETVEVADVA